MASRKNNLMARLRAAKARQPRNPAVTAVEQESALAEREWLRTQPFYEHIIAVCEKYGLSWEVDYTMNDSGMAGITWRIPKEWSEDRKREFNKAMDAPPDGWAEAG